MNRDPGRVQLGPDAAAKVAACGASPWMHRVSGSIATMLPSTAWTCLILHHALDLRHRGLDVVDQRIRPAARRQAAVGLIGTIGEDLVGHRDAGVPTGADQLAPRQAVQHQAAVEVAHRTGDRSGQLAVTRRHVVQRAVRFDVMQASLPAARANAASAPTWYTTRS